MLEPLAPGGSRRLRRRAFDLHADEPVDAADEVAPSDEILVLDGLFLHRDEMCGIWDYSVFLEVELAVSVARCAARGPSWASVDADAPSNRRYVLGQKLYLSRCAPERRATCIIDNNVLAAPAIRRLRYQE